MTNNDFDKVVMAQLDYTSKLLLSKGKEYANNNIDRLIAFKQAGVIQQQTAKQALCGMMAKHVVSVFDMCNTNEEYPMDRWVEKITDNINYLILLRALVEEEANSNQEGNFKYE